MHLTKNIKKPNDGLFCEIESFSVKKDTVPKMKFALNVNKSKVGLSVRKKRTESLL